MNFCSINHLLHIEPEPVKQLSKKEKKKLEDEEFEKMMNDLGIDDKKESKGKKNKKEEVK